jgi:hypothetical protein
MLRWLAAILTIVRAFLVGYISDYDLGFSRQQIRTLAVVGAAIIDLICDALNAACALASSCWDKKLARRVVASLSPPLVFFRSVQLEPKLIQLDLHIKRAAEVSMRRPVFDRMTTLI